MNISIRFEDTYGCYTLFRNSPSILNNDTSIEISEALGNGNVLKIKENAISKNDFVIAVFDLDGTRDISITSQDLRKTLERHIIDSEGNINEQYKNKLILIPVFFAFETCYFYSDDLCNIIYSNKDILREERLINAYKKYYDYYSLNPESLFNSINKVIEMSSDSRKIRNMTSKKSWSPQHIHLKYTEELLKCKFPKIKQNYNSNIFVKNEDDLFNAIVACNGVNELNKFIDSILNGMMIQATHNRAFYKLLTLKHYSELENLVLDNNKLNILYDELDNYNLSIKGIKKDYCDIADKLVMEAYDIYSRL